MERESAKNQQAFVFIREEHLLLKIRLEEILFVMSDSNYIEVYLQKKKYTLRAKLAEFEDRVPASLFVRVHQRYLINLSKVDTIGRSFVILGNRKIPVSKSHYPSLIASVLVIP